MGKLVLPLSGWEVEGEVVVVVVEAMVRFGGVVREGGIWVWVVGWDDGRKDLDAVSGAGSRARRKCRDNLYIV